MAVTASNILAGPCTISLDGTDIGATEGGIRIIPEIGLRERTVDQYGNTPVDVVSTGDRVTIICSIAEWTYANLQIVFPTGYLGTTYVGIGREPGHTYSGSTKEMVLHPMEQDGTGKDITFWKVYPTAVSEIGMLSESDRLFEVTFVALLDTSRNDGELLGKFGTA